MLDFVARAVIEQHIEIPGGSVRTAWNGGEMLFEEQSMRFRKAFGVPILNFYGGRELGPIAYQSEHEGPLKILRPLLFLEIVDESDRPALPGTPGRILLTSTTCRGTPFVRYELGDVGCTSPEHVDESGIRALTELQGRVAGLLRLPDGRTINCIFWNHLFKDYAEIEQFQVVVTPERIHVRLKGPGMSTDRREALEGVLGRFLGDLPFDVSFTNHIPLTRQGKFEQVIREQ